MSHARRVLTLVALSAVAFGCRGSKTGPVVAEGDGVVISVDQFKAKLEEQSPFVRARYASLDRKKEFLENLLRFELLAAEARRQKLDQDPEVQETLKKIMVQRLVRKSFDEGAATDVPESDLRQYYDEHKDEFVKAERVRVSQILVRSAPNAPDRGAREAAARKIVARLKAEQAKNPLAFASLAREASDDAATKASGGDLGYRTREELEKQYGKAVAEAAFGLQRVGDESPVVASDEGFHLLKLAARQPALDRPFESVKAQLAGRVARERRTKDFDGFVQKLRSSAGIKVNDGELEKITVTAAAAPPGAPGAEPGHAAAARP